MRQLLGLFGNLTAWLFVIAVCNFFAKWLLKHVINKLPAQMVVWKKLYLKVMRIIVKYHRYFGLAAGIFVLVHFYSAYSIGRMRPSGLIGVAFMAVLILLGAYGYLTRKQRKGAWFQMHRAMALCAGIIIVVHLTLW